MHHSARAFFRRASVALSSHHVWRRPALIQQMYGITDRYLTSRSCLKSLSVWSVVNSSHILSRTVFFLTYSQPTDAVVWPTLLFLRSSSLLLFFEAVAFHQTNTIITLVNALVVSRIDYCNAVLAGVPRRPSAAAPTSSQRRSTTNST